MKNKTFISIIMWVALWTLITVIYLLFRYEFAITAILYAITGSIFFYIIAKEEFPQKRFKNAI